MGLAVLLVWVSVSGIMHGLSRCVCVCVCVVYVCVRSASQKKQSLERSKSQAAEYHKLLVQRLKEQRERRSESLAKKRALRQASVASKEAPAAK